MTSSSAGQSPDTPKPLRVWWDPEVPMWLLVDRGEGRPGEVEVWTSSVLHAARGLPDEAIPLLPDGSNLCPACGLRELSAGRCGSALDSCGYNAASFAAPGVTAPARPTVDEIATALHEDCTAANRVIGLRCRSASHHRSQAERLAARLAAPGVDTAASGLSAEREQRFEHLATLGPNWDSYDAQPPSAVALVKAREIAVILAGSPLICPTPDGGVQLAWPPDGERFEIVVAESGAVGITVDDVEFGPVFAALAARAPQPTTPDLGAALDAIAVRRPHIAVDFEADSPQAGEPT